jgi:hypothetical protein
MLGSFELSFRNGSRLTGRRRQPEELGGRAESPMDRFFDARHFRQQKPNQMGEPIYLTETSTMMTEAPRIRRFCPET